MTTREQYRAAYRLGRLSLQGPVAWKMYGLEDCVINVALRHLASSQQPVSGWVNRFRCADFAAAQIGAQMTANGLVWGVPDDNR